MSIEQNSEHPPSYKYFGWGAMEGILTGILITESIDISEIGISSIILDAFKPLLKSAGMSTGWITFLIVILGFIGYIILFQEAREIWMKGQIPRAIAICGFCSMLFLLINPKVLGVIFLFIGVAIVHIFPDK